MPKKLDLARFQKSRESQVDAGAFGFTIRRPSALDVARAGAAGGGITLEYACKYVVGWSRVNESDLIPSGDPEPLEFDSALLFAWVSDRPELWEPIVSGVINSFRAYEEASEDRGNV